MIQLIVTSLGGGKQITEEATANEAIGEAEKLLTSDTRGVRKIRVIDGHAVIRAWRSYVRWADVTPADPRRRRRTAGR